MTNWLIHQRARFHHRTWCVYLIVGVGSRGQVFQIMLAPVLFVEFYHNKEKKRKKIKIFKKLVSRQPENCQKWSKIAKIHLFSQFTDTNGI